MKLGDLESARRRPSRGLGRQPECWTTPSNLNPLHRVLITFVYTFKLLLHSCTHSSYSPRPHCFTRGPAHHCLHSFTPSTCGVKAPQVQFITRTFKLFSTPCTPLQFGGPGALHTTPCTVTPLHQVLSVKALHSPSACSVDIPPSTFCVKALHSQSTCGARPYYICTTRS